jgi:hypothetical protein
MEQYLDIFKLLTLMINENILGSNSKIISKEIFINNYQHQKKKNPINLTGIFD